jgi:hypothetical protein
MLRDLQLDPASGRLTLVRRATPVRDEKIHIS